MRYVLAFVLIVITSFGIFLANYLGAFKGVDISESQQGPFQTLYLEHVGPYHKVSKEIGKVEAYMKSKGSPCERSFGEYLDDPHQVEEARLRAHVGCIVESIPADLAPELKVGEIPSRHYVIAVFTGSPGIGPVKVYPKVAEYMASKGLKQTGAVIEIYEIHSIAEKNAMTTTYLFPVE